MKKKRIIVTLICMLVVILGMVGLYFYGLTSVSEESDEVSFTVKSGASTKQVINNLYDAKLIKSKIAANIYIKLNKGIMIKAGEYDLDRKFSTEEIFKILSGNNAKVDTITVKFPEEASVTKYAQVIHEKFGYSEEEVLATISDKEYLKELINKYGFLNDDILNSDIYYPLEGYLYPDTYEFYKSASIKNIIEKLLDKMGKVLDNYNTSIKGSEFSVHEILTIASIIENESKFDEDRSIVSQVIRKRLSINMSLGMDVTTYYGVRKALSETLTQSDLNNENAYNTRRTDFLGLPVGPICNPSERSIKAALNPSDTDYLYFYAEVSTGKLHFAKTHSEFQELIRKYS
jgi:UPF0755 protein